MFTNTLIVKPRLSGVQTNKHHMCICLSIAATLADEIASAGSIKNSSHIWEWRLGSIAYNLNEDKALILTSDGF